MSMITKSELENVRKWNTAHDETFAVRVRQRPEGDYVISVKYYYSPINETICTWLCELDPTDKSWFKRQLVVCFNTAEEAMAYCGREGIELTELNCR